MECPYKIKVLSLVVKIYPAVAWVDMLDVKKTCRQDESLYKSTCGISSVRVGALRHEVNTMSFGENHTFAESKHICKVRLRQTHFFKSDSKGGPPSEVS